MGKWTYPLMNGKQMAMKALNMSNVKWSKVQQANPQRFSEAIFYARRAMEDPKVRAHYEKAGKKAGR